MTTSMDETNHCSPICRGELGCRVELLRQCPGATRSGTQRLGAELSVVPDVRQVGGYLTTNPITTLSYIAYNVIHEEMRH
jgi:hypothetical protein